jgi:AraC family transcriptional regulator
MILANQLASGSSLVLSKASTSSADSLFLIVGGGRGCTLKVDEPYSGLWVPLRGRLQIGGGSGDGVLIAGEMRVTEAEPRLHAVGRGNAVWVALLGGRTT